DSTSLALESVDLAAAREELLELGRRRGELTALVAHDIKNPAAGLMLRAQTRLRQADMSESERRAWSSVFACAEAVTRLATNLVDVAQSEEGALQVACRPLEVRGLFEEVERLMRPLAETRSQRLDATSDAGCMILADRDVLVRVLVNLVENAVSHNPRGG